MADSPDPLDPAPASTDVAAAPETSPGTLRPAMRDAHGFDPDDYEWIPVPRQQRRDGWSPDKQRAFIEALADTGSVTTAAEAVEMTKQSCYRLRRMPEAAGFAHAWDAAIEQAGKALLDMAFDRVIHGEEVPVFDKDGRRIACRQRYSDRMTMFLIRAYNPGLFGPDCTGPADGGARRTIAHDPAPPPAVDAAIEALYPVCPAEPHELMPPDQLAAFIEDDIANELEEARFQRDHPEAAARETARMADPSLRRRAAPPGPPPVFDEVALLRFDCQRSEDEERAAPKRQRRRASE